MASAMPMEWRWGFYVLAFLFSFLPTVGYIGLKKRFWIIRNILIAYSVLLLLHFPFGTAAGIYQLIILTQLRKKDKYFIFS